MLNDKAAESKRKSSVELPQVKEIETILAREAKRPIAAGKESLHSATFVLPTKWFKLLGLDTDIFAKNLSWQELVAIGSEIQSTVVARTLELVRTGNKELEDLMLAITEYLGEEDKPQASEAIYVFGSKSLARIETAVNLYNQGLAPRIFITGGMPVYEQREKSEAIIFKDWAVEHGISLSAIACHDTAISVPDNVRGGLNTMDSIGWPHDTLILVTAWFAMRRSWATMMKYVSRGSRLYRVNAAVNATGDFAADKWWKNETGIKTIFNEFGKMKISEALNTS